MHQRQLSPITSSSSSAFSRKTRSALTFPVSRVTASGAPVRTAGAPASAAKQVSCVPRGPVRRVAATPLELILAFLYASSSLTHASVDLETCDHVLGLSLFPPRKFRDFLKKSIAVSSFKDPQSWPCCRLAVLPQITADIATDAKKLQGSMIWHDDLLETRVILDFKSV